MSYSYSQVSQDGSLGLVSQVSSPPQGPEPEPPVQSELLCVWALRVSAKTSLLSTKIRVPATSAKIETARRRLRFAFLDISHLLRYAVEKLNAM